MRQVRKANGCDTCDPRRSAPHHAGVPQVTLVAPAPLGASEAKVSSWTQVSRYARSRSTDPK